MQFEHSIGGQPVGAKGLFIGLIVPIENMVNNHLWQHDKHPLLLIFSSLNSHDSNHEFQLNQILSAGFGPIQEVPE